MKIMGQIIFHGGCCECTQQLKNGIDFCVKCQYFQADWTLPDLNNRPPNRAEIVRAELKKKHKVYKTEEQRCTGSALNDLLSENSSGDLLDVWELFRTKCPWSEHKQSWDGTEFSCIGIRYGDGAGRECSMKMCAPFYFVKTLTECAAS